MNDLFDTAANEATRLKKTPTSEEKAQLYGLYKQALHGDVNSACPGMTDLTGRTKWFAWESKKGVSKEDAKKAYVDLVEKLKAKYGLNEAQAASSSST